MTLIEVDVTRPRADTLALAYVVTGKMDDLALPPVSGAERTDELWRHTCFEAFVRASSGRAYYEFNFAPSMQWAAYRFDDYRSGMCLASEIVGPRIAVDRGPERYVLRAALELDQRNAAPWRLALAAVIEETGGRQSYWALAHPAGKADFHHSDGFALEVD